MGLSHLLYAATGPPLFHCRAIKYWLLQSPIHGIVRIAEPVDELVLGPELQSNT